MISEDKARASSVFRVFDYKQAEIQEQRLCDCKFWIKAADDRAKIEFDYYRRLNEWYSSYQATDLQQDITDAVVDYKEGLLLKDDINDCYTRQQLAKETGKLFEDFSIKMKKINVCARSPSYISILKKYKSALKVYQRKSKKTNTAKQKYECKLQKQSRYDVAPQERFHNINKMKARVDIAKKLFEYHQLQEIAARNHLILASDQLRNIWETELEKKLTTVAQNWEKCITSVRLLEQKMATSPTEDSSHFDLRQNKDALHLNVHSAAEQLCMTLEMIAQDTEEEGKPPTRASSQVSVTSSICTERSGYMTYEGSETDSVEEIDFDYARYNENNQNHYQLTFPRTQTFGKSISNGWLHGLEEGETVDKQATHKAKAYGFKVKAIKDYEKNNLREISLKSGLELRQMFPPNETGYAFGYKRNKFHKRCFGYFPADHVQVIY